MIADEEREGFAAFLLRMRARNVTSNELLSAIEETPRGGFVPSEWRDRVWSNRTVPIECGETMEPCDLQATVISALDLAPGKRVLEIGTGSGYTAAVMARLTERVLTIDRYRTLVDQAAQRHDTLDVKNVIQRQADGLNGVDDGPFDRIVVWAAFEEMPRRFVDFLTTEGLMIAPIGPGDGIQSLAKLEKVGSRFERTELENVRMQPLIEGVAQAL